MEKGTVKLSLEDAKELYSEGGKFRAIALSAYSEEELSIFKEGNFLVSGWNSGGIGAKWVCIYKKGNSSNYYYYVNYLTRSNNDSKGKITYNSNANSQTYTRLATKEEKELLLNAIHKEGKDWDPINKKIITYNPPYEPKEGEFVYLKVKNFDWEWLFIKKGNDYNTEKYVSIDISKDKESFHSECPSYDGGCCGNFDIKELRPATLEEQKDLIDALHKDGNDWDFENKKIIPYKWKPEYKEGYYTLTYVYTKGFRPILLHWFNDTIDRALFDKNLVFKAEEAEAKAKELNHKCNF